MNRLAVYLIFACIVGCSSANREGPDITCDDIDGGLNNACEQGIIAYCQDQEVKYKVCTVDNDEEAAKKICEEPWQIPRRYRCAQEDPDCQGCTGP